MLTGQEYKASLDDGRAIYFEGKRVESVVTHPFIRSTHQLLNILGSNPHSVQK